MAVETQEHYAGVQRRPVNQYKMGVIIQFMLRDVLRSKYLLNDSAVKLICWLANQQTN